MMRERFADEMERIEKQIHERFGLNAAAFDPSGARITGYVNFANPLCKRIKADPQSNAAICAVANQHFLRHTEGSGEPMVGECDAGLCKIGVPVMVGGVFIGMVGGCGRPVPDMELEYFVIEKATGLGRDEADGLCGGLAPVSQAEVSGMLGYLGDELGKLAG